MKRLIVCVAALALMGTVSFGQVTQVVSRNAVGFVRVTAPVDGLVMASYDFEDIDGDNVDAARLIGDQLPTFAVVHAFEPGVGYISDNKGPLGWSTNIVFRRGQGFWIELPPVTPPFVTGTEYQVHLMGEVPDSINSGVDTKVRVVDGLTQLGYPYPTADHWTNLQIAKNGAFFDVIHYWDGSGYVSENKGPLGWSDKDLIIEPGMAFFYETTVSGATQLWTEVKPYTWPE